MTRKSYLEQAAVETWLARQGYGLERQTAADLRLSGFRSTLGRHYLDPSTGKIREIDLVAEGQGFDVVRIFATVECKHSSTGAWIARESSFAQEHRSWQPIASDSFERIVRRNVNFPITNGFWLGRDRHDDDRCAFSVVEATDESNDQAYAAISQAVSGAPGWAAQTSPDKALVLPVVVFDGPLFALHHADGGDLPITAVDWRRILWGESRDQTIVDVVRSTYVQEYGVILREALTNAARVARLFFDDAT